MLNSDHQQQQQHNRSIGDLMRSNPDLKNGSHSHCHNHSQNHHNPHHNHQHHHLNMYSPPCGASVKNTSAELSNLSNNLSLNLSIHTAEEFGIEMLEWLNNEAAMKSAAEAATKLTTAPTNATLV